MISDILEYAGTLDNFYYFLLHTIPPKFFTLHFE